MHILKHTYITQIVRLSYLCSVIPVNFDVAVSDWYGEYVERYNNGMESSVFISYNCAGKLPFYISISLKTEQY